MHIEFDPEADALYIRFRNAKPKRNKDIEEGITVDLDEKHRLIGIEILNVSHRFPAEVLSTVTVQNLLTSPS